MADHATTSNQTTTNTTNQHTPNRNKQQHNHKNNGHNTTTQQKQLHAQTHQPKQFKTKQQKQIQT